MTILKESEKRELGNLGKLTQATGQPPLHHAPMGLPTVGQGKGRQPQLARYSLLACLLGKHVILGLYMPHLAVFSNIG